MFRYVWLVALREYAENAKTKGFWIGIFMFPLMLIAGFKVPRLLDKETPTRHFIVIDHSKQFDSIINNALERDAAKELADAQRAHMAKVLEAGAKKVGTLEAALTAALDPDVKKKVQDSLAQTILDVVRSGRKELGPEIGDEWMKQLKPEERVKLQSVLAEWTMKAQAAGAPSAPKFEEPRKRVHRAELPEGVTGDDFEALRPYLTAQKMLIIDGKPAELFAVVIIPENIGKAKIGSAFEGVQYWSTNLTDSSVKDVVRDAVEEELKSRAFTKNGITPERVEQIQKTRLKLAERDPSKAVGKEEVSFGDTVRQWAPVGAVYLLWVAIFTVAQMLLNNTTEEKTNRVIEVLLSSVTPTELMFGKLVGIAAIGLTMMAAWIGSFVVMLNFILQGATGNEALVVNAVRDALFTPELLLAFSGYFFLGYLLYAGVFLAIGSVVNSIKEAQNMMGPIMLIMMVPLFTMVFIAKDPNGALAKALSWIPLYTPFVMMNRAAASPPAFDVYGTLALLVVSVIVAIWLSGRVFRIGILRTGQPPKLMEMLRWMRG